ncbi:hypothetical protein CDL12_08984 [Handroanthus impetiginosus]|uniref:Homeobox domain-containing protein n=1 Tax=Handroanthus impetiginosus TaxID=429701 RepID=A0A2G9HLE3_9LAMI|nr:hypothetical protein CDL12_08984 [Handroanthus impetiginosus]
MIFDMNSNASEANNSSSTENPDKNFIENQQSKRKRFHRHTPRQIQELEAFFKECPHPNNKQRKELSRRLGMEPMQVKFWYQNKRTQMKTQHARQKNAHLRIENEKLRAENTRYKEALSNACCPTCGGIAAARDLSSDEHRLRIENARLRQEIEEIAAAVAKNVGKPVTGPIIRAAD